MVWITDRLVTDLHRLGGRTHPLVPSQESGAGCGCERGIPVEALADGLATFLQQACMAPASIAALASLDRKADEAAILALARRHGWQTYFYAATELARVPGIARPSQVVERCVGTPGVAEPAALRAAQAERLLIEKQVVTSTRSPNV